MLQALPVKVYDANLSSFVTDWFFILSECKRYFT